MASQPRASPSRLGRTAVDYAGTVALSAVLAVGVQIAATSPMVTTREQPVLVSAWTAFMCLLLGWWWRDRRGSR